MQKPMFLALCLLSVGGLVVGVWAHAVALVGVDPQSLFQRLWMFQLILFFLLLPLALRALQRGLKKDPLGLSRREWRILFAVLIYYAGNFYFFLARAAEHLRAALTWQMFSSGWILLFLLAALYYRARFLAA